MAGQGSAFMTVFRQSVLDRWVVPLVIGALMVGMGLLTGGLWPSLESTMKDLPGSLNELGKVLAGSDMTTGAGWANAEIVSMVAPMGVIAVAIMAVLRGLPGEEESKVLGAVLSAPVARSTFLWAKTAAMVVQVVVASLSVALGLVVGSLVGGLGLTAAGVVGVTLHVALLGVLFGAVAAAVGAATGVRRLTMGVTAGAATVAFVAWIVVPLVDAIDGWVRLSPWYYFNSTVPLVNGPDPSHLLVLAVASLAWCLVAVVLLGRRDLKG